ncbi:MAG: hypothetical protein J7L88_00685, partial [Thermoplasmata archaeon]|nr:hypothetical protein [Thermoplasmata archaeon]
EGLDDFEPLVDAVVLPEKPEVKVVFRRRSGITLKDIRSRFEEGEEAYLPLYAAVFAVGIGAAEMPEKPVI